MKKVLLKKLLVCILIIIMSCNFVFSNINFVYAENSDSNSEISLGDMGSNIVTGLIGILLYPITIVPTATFIGLASALGGVARLSLGNVQGYGESGIDSATITPFHVLFNKIPLVDINFFDIDGASGEIKTFREAVAGWYYTMRLLASMVLLVILIYVGIRMALSSIATEKAMYKKMLVDWSTSLALLFLLHYIMMFVFACNDALVKALESAADNTNIDNLMSELVGQCFHFDIVVRTAALIIYGMIIFQTISFLISYIKRMLTIGFLIIIAPLITITYSVDKIGDGKAQALNTWLKEFILNILLQPFQCILYLVFANIAMKLLTSGGTFSMTANNIGKSVFAIMCMHFIKEGEKIIKKIFGFDKASTAGDLAAGAALTSAAIFKGKDVAAKAGSTLGKAKNTIKGSRAGKAISKATHDAKKQLKDNVGKAIKESKPVKRCEKCS